MSTEAALCGDCGQHPAAQPRIHITPGPSVVIRSENAGEHWCFRCRKRLPHTDVLLDDPPERQPSYYDPVWSRRCSGCGEDHTEFPR